MFDTVSEQILEALNRYHELTSGELETIVGVSQSTIKRRLADLEQMGKVATIGEGKATRYRRIDPSTPSTAESTLAGLVDVDQIAPTDVDPLVQVRVMNPIVYLKKWLKALLKDEGIHIKFSLKVKPLTVVFLAIVFVSAGLGIKTLALFFKYTPVYQPLRQLVTQPDQSYELALFGQVLVIQKAAYLISESQSPVKLDDDLNWANYVHVPVLVVGRYNPETNVLVAQAVEMQTDDVDAVVPTPQTIELKTPKWVEELLKQNQALEASSTGLFVR